jgi:hypothetical protein
MSVLSSAWSMIGLDVLMISYTLWVLGRAGTSRGLRWCIAAAMTAWLGVLHVLLLRRALFSATISGPAFLGVVILGVATVGAALFAIPTLRRLVLTLPHEALLLLQGIRVFFGAMFLVHAALGVLPTAFGIVDGLTHVGAGFFGLIAAFSLVSGPDGRRRTWFANVFGLADILLVASTLALVLLPTIGPHHIMMYAVFLPAPLWLWFHVASMWRLARGERLLARASGQTLGQQRAS